MSQKPGYGQPAYMKPSSEALPSNAVPSSSPCSPIHSLSTTKCSDTLHMQILEATDKLALVKTSYEDSIRKDAAASSEIANAEERSKHTCGVAEESDGFSRDSLEHPLSGIVCLSVAATTVVNGGSDYRIEDHIGLRSPIFEPASRDASFSGRDMHNPSPPISDGSLPSSQTTNTRQSRSIISRLSCCGARSHPAGH